MPTSRALKKKNSNKTGFTLLELLVVIVIIGLGLVTLAPKIANNTVMGDSTENFFDTVITEQLKNAKELGRPVAARGVKGSDSLTFEDGKTETIPEGNIQTARINGEETSGVNYEIYFYPDGIFDQFELVTESKKTISANTTIKKAVITENK